MNSLRMLMMTALTFFVISVFAQDSTKQKAKGARSKTEITKYSCPMHPDVTSGKPGKCTKCGMELTVSSKVKMKKEMTKMYSCPMHPDITSNKPGKCSKCNMDLVEKKDDHSKHQHK